MKIYFAGSIRGGRDDKDLYFEIIKFIQKYGTVLTEHIGDKDLSDKGEAEKDPKFIHDRDIDWVKESDIIVAEVTTPSLGVGYEIGRGYEMGKKIICLFRPNNGRLLSNMILGCPGVEVIEYLKLDDLKPKLDDIIN